MRYSTLTLAILVATTSTQSHANSTDDDTPTVQLEALQVTVSTNTQSSLAFADTKKASDLTVKKEVLKHRSSTLGNALALESGIHSNPFGGGASAPVVRGQEGVRVKVLNNGLNVADMANVSPDHAIAVDTLLASRVEVVRGASTLMHANASPAGVINVIDERVPKHLPDGVTGESLFRFNTGSDEKLATASLVFPVADKLALRVEGMKRSANPYNVPAINFGEVLDYLPDSYNNSTVGTLGASYIGEKGYLGVAYSERKDNYGLVGHNHKFDHCEGHVFDTSRGFSSPERKYLIPYPHLMSDEDLVKGFHFHCGTDYDQDPSHSHEHVYGHKHDHTQKGPWVDLKSKTFTLQGEINSPIPSIDKIRLSASHSDYAHQEHDEGKHVPDPSKGTVFVQGNTSYWGNQGLSAKLSVHQSPTDRLSLVWGLDNQTNKTHALIPSLTEKAGNRRLLVNNTQKTNSLFGLSEYKIGNLKLHTALRHERTSIPVVYNMDEINAQINSGIGTQESPNLTPYTNRATSYALGAIWDISPKLRLDATYSHNERTPTPMELYYHGKHLATNSFLYGNKNLSEEKSNNGELGLTFKGDKWQVKGSIYTNHFDNYIHPENLYKNGNLSMRRFTQSKARLKGAELEIGYQVNDNLNVSVFGDVVRGKLYNFAPIFGNNIYEERFVGYDEDCWYEPDEPEYEEECRLTENVLVGQDTIVRPDRNAPRMSPDRIGVRMNGNYGNFSPSLEYIRVSAQNRTSNSVSAKYNSECPYHNDENRLCPIYINEDATNGYHLLNIGLDYHRNIGNSDTTWSIRLNNALNEKIYVHNSFLPFVPQQGRNISLSVSTKF
ncbi:iron-regulated outer membrane protein [Moraxella bovoculi]|uniref:Iron-regulated outer membrane protein n=1 Tax=Moraxella bovoculi TaxID=386891 RepID=A0AAC8PUV9_9GAMM|nr:TonB-dependent receptor [Moraxella bovoculi]AKG07204.1 iron-regulated outer membrane protein [Moraxella bovoculi]AKG10190.1 iron-regulated outer membrane protein [Moraxella bovoculi]AKG12112.1 iron-regulated outer membrane protein [Moraxella bovoculi]AKG14080.1 iron-regulated outer membrane protein [Moraxella bovoculi]